MFSLIDTGRVLLAVAACGLVLVLPGQALARAFAQGDEERSELSWVVFGFALLPLIDSLVTRLIGLDAALAVTLALAIVAVVTRRQSWGRPTPLALALGLAWLALVVIQWIDLDIGGKLFQPLTVVDTVKHAATTQAIVDGGAPPRDAFFLRPQSASYYYFFYSLTALVERVGCGWIDARAAVGGTVFWVGIGLFGLVRFAKRRAGLSHPDRTRRETILILCMLAAGGLDCLAVLRTGLLNGTWFADPMSWNEQVTNWLESVLWVPHHVTALIASVVGLATLAATAEAKTAQIPVRGIVLGGLCFASSFGLSVWVTFALVATVGVWGLMLVLERRWKAIGLIVAAGILALVVALPQLLDLQTGRAPGESLPIALTVRAFAPTDTIIQGGLSRLIVRFALLPVNYFAGFGALFSGALLFWTTHGTNKQNEFGRLLTISAIVGLFLGAFFRSTIFNNDLGWRVLLFPLLAGVVWTIAAIERLLAAEKAPVWRTVPPLLGALICLGWATSLYAFVSLRAYPWFANDEIYKFVSEAPATERALRVAYQWADVHLPSQSVLQHDPLRPRAFAFALYGRNRTAVSDGYGGLYGANRAAVDARIAALAPIFQTVMSPDAVRATAQANGIDDLVVTDQDPAWSKPDSFVWHVTPLYASDRVRIIATRSLGGAVADAR